MAKYFSASMINNEGVFQCCFPIDCVAEGDEDHLIKGRQAARSASVV